MNEFHAVTVDELTQVDGGGILGDLYKAVKGVIREVVNAIQKTGKPIT